MATAPAGSSTLFAPAGNKSHAPRVPLPRAVERRDWCTHAVARRLAQSSEGAEDVVQEAIPRAFRGFEQQLRRAQVPLPEEHDLQDGDEERTLERLLAGLPEGYREILILREVEDMDYRQIAAVVNVPLGTVMSRLARARAMLRKHWLQQAEGAPRRRSVLKY
jgi:RNA polymerase sigma-70 factor, ECF subfamily